jgi:hypothetical protein
MERKIGELKGSVMSMDPRELVSCGESDDQLLGDVTASTI